MSHNTMGTFFSSTDSADEVSTRIFGVIGRMSTQHENFEASWRAGVQGHFATLQLDDIWDSSDTTEYVIPESAFDNVTELTYSQPKMIVSGETGTATGNGVRIIPKSPPWANRGHSGHHRPSFMGYASFDDSDYFGIESDLHVDTQFMYVIEGMKQELDKLFNLKNSGLLDKPRYTQVVRDFVDFLCDQEEFDKQTAFAMLDQISANLTDADFRETFDKFLA